MAEQVEIKAEIWLEGGYRFLDIEGMLVRVDQITEIVPEWGDYRRKSIIKTVSGATIYSQFTVDEIKRFITESQPQRYTMTGTGIVDDPF